MSNSEAHRQKKLAKKHKKSKLKHSGIVARKQELRSVMGMMKAASGGEIIDCHRGYQGCAGEINGMVPVVLRRRGPGGAVAFAFFLVDAWCLGVKDCAGELLTASESKERLEHLQERVGLERCSAAEGKAVVDGGVAYARALGLEPHPDFPKAYPIWGDVQAASIPSDVEFGRDGRPTYIVGPYDDRHRQQLILNMLRSSVGEGNFDWVSPLDQFHSGSRFTGWDEIPDEVLAELSKESA